MTMAPLSIIFQRLIKEQKLFESTAEDVKSKLEANYQTQESLKVSYNYLSTNLIKIIINLECGDNIELDQTCRKIILFKSVQS